MKRKYPAITMLSFIENSTPSVVIRMGNSWEVLQGYYLEKIQELNNRLQQLNIMENALEISGICHEIIRAKKALHRLNIKASYLA
jgi:hypothetical protein